MSLNDTPSGERLHIAFFGRRNAGKSSLVNAITGQELSVVSDVKGTTTDPVRKAMELLPLGPVLIIDTPGFDDSGSLGNLRVKKTMQILNRTDIAVLVIDSTAGKTPADTEIIELFRKKDIPYIIVYSKSDISGDIKCNSQEICVSASNGKNINELKELIASLKSSVRPAGKFLADLINPGDIVVLVTPIDSAAPKGRLILPQQLALREILDADAVSVVTKENRLEETLKNLAKKPSMVITDSQVFEEVSTIVPDDIPLTSFSILMARSKGFLKSAYEGAAAIDDLHDGDTILISEGCTHHRQCDDIGTVKIPRWLKKHTGKNLKLEFSSGNSFPEELSGYSLIIHCGGCMLNARELNFRRQSAADAGIPFTNYGIAIAHMKGILKRSTAVIPEINQKDEI